MTMRSPRRARTDPVDVRLTGDRAWAFPLAAVLLTLALFGSAFLAAVFLFGMICLPAADGSLRIERASILTLTLGGTWGARPSKRATSEVRGSTDEALPSTKGRTRSVGHAAV